MPACTEPSTSRHKEPTLQGRRLSCSFGRGAARTTPLRGASLDLYRGQLALLMGVSGSGKSTLLSVLSGMQPPDAGSVLLLGEDFWRKTAREQERFRLRHFGFVFQKPNLIPALTARQQLEMMLCWGEGTPAREARQRAEQMLSRLGLADRADCRPQQLSGGEQQRVAIGRALIKEPTFLFADEPTSALDHEYGRSMVELLRDTAHERGATVLVVTHDQGLVPFADQIFQLQDGRLARQVASGRGKVCCDDLHAVQNRAGVALGPFQSSDLLCERLALAEAQGGRSGD